MKTREVCKCGNPKVRFKRHGNRRKRLLGHLTKMCVGCGKKITLFHKKR